MGHIRQRKLRDGSVRHQAEIRLKGHPILTATFDRKTDAKAWIQKTESDIRCGRHQVYTARKRHTFKEAVEHYFQEYAVSQAKKWHLAWWTEHFGALYLQDIRPALITKKKQKLLTEINTKGKVRTPSTCNRFLASLSHLLSICVRQWELLAENPVSKISREKEPRGRTRFLTPNERKRLIEACQQSDNPLLTTFVVLLLSTGCRYSEIRKLKWTDTDPVKGRIAITKSKNGDPRTVPICGLGLELPRKLAVLSYSIGYIFAFTNKAHPMDPRRALKTAIKRAGLEGNFRPHDCRHSFASELLAHRLSLGEIGHLLGHRNVATTRRYAHLVESRVVDVVSKMSEQIFREVKNG